MILAMANQKGGVGKTTVAVNLAYGLAISGRRVLLIDMDPQGSAGHALGMGEGPGAALLMSGSPMGHCVQQARAGLDLVQADINLAQISKQIEAMAMGRERVLARALSDQSRWDIVIIDCPPGMGFLTINAFAAANQIIAPVSLGHLDTVGLAQLIDMVVVANAEGYNVALGMVVPNMARATNESRRVLWMLRQNPILGDLCSDPIPLNTDIKAAQARGQTIWEYNRHCPGAKAFARLVHRICNVTRSC